MHFSIILNNLFDYYVNNIIIAEFTMIELKLKKILSNTFKCNISDIDEESSIYKIKNWDSLTHYELIDALEDEFNVKISDAESETLTSYKIILATIKSYNAK
tara:strand:- start:406 stop:711 length:306 start_codon:yes stop_codon:yes gene_type:complete